ncbi:O-antigen polymerase [Acinetobacter baumannii]|uniref:O-antigen polymerase n=1 Tax=Acinetobacter baumannii TaxID=470 RepID=UPI003891D766|nr:oligosaccharide repeat unit polymerase [Acinetobacter baumannii]
MFYFNILPWIILIYFEYKIKSPFIILSLCAGLLYFLSVPLIIGNYPVWVGEEVNRLAFIFFVVYLFSRFIINTLFKISYKKIFPNDLDKVKKISFLFMFIAIFFSFASFGFSYNAMINSNWTDYRDNAGITGLIVQYSYLCGSSLLLIGLLQKDKKIIIFSVFAGLFFLFVLKSRGYLISLVLPVVCYYFLNDKMSLKRISFILLTVVIVVALYIFTRYIRIIGSLSDVNFSNLNFSDILGEDAGELQLIDVLFQVIFRKDYHYLHVDNLVTIKNFIYFFIPDFVVDKPKDLAYAVWDYYIGIRGVNGSFHPTVIGEAYFNNKNYGVIIYPIFLASLIGLYEKVLSRRPEFLILVYGVVVFSATALARGSSHNAFVVMIICIIVLYTFYRVGFRWKY